MKKLALSVSLAALVSSFGCDKSSGSTSNIPKPRDLAPGGVYVAYNLGCEQGCDKISKGELIQTMDGQPVSTAADLDNLTDGSIHDLEVLSEGELKQVAVKASPKNTMPPLEKVPPFWLVGAEALNRAPEWARGRMFGHASPSIQLVYDGGIIDGRQLAGTKRFMVYWDWGDREEEATAVNMMKVLQRAQGDLEAAGIDLMFVHVRFPNGRKAPMNDTDLKAWASKWSEKEGNTKLPPVPLYRFPNETEFNPARDLGLENAFTVMENLSRSPAIVILDERGIVRWHSDGVMDPRAIGSEVQQADQATIIRAIEFAMNDL